MKTKTKGALCVLTLLAILGLCGPARGGGFPELISVAPQPFWTTLNFFRAEPKVSLILVAPVFGQAQPDYAAANGADFSALAGFNDNSNDGFAPMVVVNEKTNRESAPANLDPGSGHKSLGSSRPGLADNWSRIDGVGSTIPTYSTGFGSVSDNSSSIPDSSQGQLAGSDVRQSDREAAQATSTVTEAGTPPAPLAGPDRGSHSLRDGSTVSIGGITFSSETANLGGQGFSPKALSIGPDAVTATRAWTGPGGTTSAPTTGNWNVTTNWSANGTPATGDTLTFGGSGASPYTSTNNLVVADCTIQLNSTASVAEVIAGNFAQIQTLLTITQQNSGAFNISSSAQFKSAQLTLGGNGTGIVTLSGVFSDQSGGNVGNLVKTGTSTFVLSGANTYTGGTTLSGGILSVSANNNLGGTSGSVTMDGGTLQLNGLTLGSGRTVNVTSNGGTFDAISTPTIASSITNGTGAGSSTVLTKTGSSSLTLTGANSGYTGQWSVTAGTLNLNGTTAVTTSANAITLSGSGGLRVTSGTGVTIGSLNGSGTGTINPTSTTAATLTVTQGSNGGVSNVIQDNGAGVFSLSKAGAATLTLTGTNTYTGVTTIGAGTLSVATIGNGGVAGNLGQASTAAANLVFDGGTLQYTGLTASTNRNFTINTGKTATFDITTNNLTVSGVSTATNGALTKIGAGTLTLSGGSANTYTGLTTISLGELDLLKTAGVNAIAGDGNTGTNDVTINGGTLKWLASNQIADSASILMSSGAFSLNGFTETIFNFSNSGGTFTTGTGTLHGTGASITWSGGTNTVNNGGTTDDAHIIITGGTNTVNGGATGGLLHLLSGGTGLEMTGSTLTLDSSNSIAGKLLLDGNLATLASATTSSIANGGANTNAGNIDLNGGSRTFTVADGAAATDLSISASIINGSLTKAGNGLANLSGANSYNGTTVSAGTLRVSGSGTLGSNTGSLTVNGGTVDVNGTSQTVGALSGSGGTILNNGGATNLTFGNGGGSGSYGGVIANGTGSLGLIKTGAGIETFTGANTYSGTTQVNAGTLLINGNQSAATGAVSVNNTGTLLGGTGTIGGAVTVNPGANITGATNGTVGTLTLASLTFSGASGNLATFIIDLIGATGDTLNISGLLDLSGTFDALSFNGTPDGTSTYLLASFGSINGIFNSAPSFAGYQYIYGVTTLELSPLTPVPEPGTWLAGALALLAIGFTQRRRLLKSAVFVSID